MIFPSAVIVAAQVLAATAPGPDVVESLLVPPKIEVVVNRGGAAEPVAFATTSVLLAAAVKEAETDDGNEAVIAEAPPAEDAEVTVFRGPGIERQAPPSGTRPLPLAERLPAVRTAGGKGLWMLDAERQRIATCRLFKTTQVYGYRLRCFQRTLRGLQ